MAVVSHAIEPFVELAARALTVRDGLVEQHEALPGWPEGRLQLLDRFARGAYPSK